MPGVTTNQKEQHTVRYPRIPRTEVDSFGNVDLDPLLERHLEEQADERAQLPEVDLADLDACAKYCEAVDYYGIDADLDDRYQECRRRLDQAEPDYDQADDDSAREGDR